MLDDKTFTFIVDMMPLVSVDLVVRGEKEVLLGLRNNRPYQRRHDVLGDDCITQLLR
jgi:hypothetical protein